MILRRGILEVFEKKIYSIVPNFISFICHHRLEEGQYLMGTANRFIMNLIKRVWG